MLLHSFICLFICIMFRPHGALMRHICRANFITTLETDLLCKPFLDRSSWRKMSPMISDMKTKTNIWQKQTKRVPYGKNNAGCITDTKLKYTTLFLFLFLFFDIFNFFFNFYFQGQLLVQFKCLVVLPIFVIFTCIFHDYVCFMANK